jgi:exportin-2 (importin alpha re-exporter)
MNPVEYIRRDAEGSDSDTRRRAAADLVKALTDKFPQEVTALCTGYVQVCEGGPKDGCGENSFRTDCRIAHRILVCGG